MTDRVALRAGVPPFYVMDVWLAAAERQRTHGDLVNLSAGQPSAGAPEPVRAAAAAALHLNQLGYSVALGIPELRDAIAADYQRRHGITVEPDAVVITTGSSGGFLLAFLACFDAGDRVAMASPGYPCYRNILSALGCEVVEIPCGPQTRFQPTAQMLAEIDPPLRGVVVASPANPTGTVIPPGGVRLFGYRLPGQAATSKKPYGASAPGCRANSSSMRVSSAPRSPISATLIPNRSLRVSTTAAASARRIFSVPPAR